MTKWIILSLTLLVCHCVAQSTIENLRYNEDYSFLRNDTSGNFYRRIKYISTAPRKEGYLTLGGEVRYQTQYFKNENWGEIAKPYAAYYNRFLFHADLHLTKSFRLFAQVNSTSATGKPHPNIDVDENRLDIHQSFFDIIFLGHAQRQFTLRLGRQELLYGSQRLISVREGPNNRLSFDGLKLHTHQTGITFDAFYANPVEIRLAGFDRYFYNHRKIWGAYTVIDNVPILNHLDIYYLGYANRNAMFDAGSGKELRHSFGTRFFNEGPYWKYDFEAVYQFGRFSQQDINAYTASGDIAYQFHHLKGAPLVGGKIDVVSGDRSRSDQEVNTFNPLFPRGAYFGLAALIGPANLIDLHPYLETGITTSVSLMIDYDLFWRYSKADGVYGPDGELMYSGDGQRSKIGNQLGLSAEYVPNEHLSLAFEFTWFEAGSHLKEISSGADVIFSAITIRGRY